MSALLAEHPLRHPLERDAVVIPFPVRPAPARPAPLRLTLRGRRLLAATALLAFVVALALAAPGLVEAVAAVVGGEPVATTTYAVAPGDTLWGIAQAVAPGEDPRDVVAEIAHLNGLSGGALAVGQVLEVPVTG